MEYNFQFGVLANYLPEFFGGLGLTLFLSFAGIFGGLGLGIACAIISVRGPLFPRAVVRIYVEIMRNTPMLVQIFVIFFGLPSLGVRLSPFTSVLVAIVLNNGGYIAEIVRAGIESIHPSQIEAAESLGLTRGQTMRFVILPPALERVMTPIISQSVLLMLATSLVSAVGVEDLTGVAMIASSETFRTMEIYLVIAVIYICLNFIFRILLNAVGLIVFKRSRQRFLGRV
ncbi:MAG: amino acid ABC transporter permease [Hyphomicrobiaceae bacterium]|nr:amino acid ABC transporter permease [Hyphomicrobiaceae bacterium]